MPKENQSELSIRLLTDALEADRLTSIAIRSVHNKANRSKSKMLFASDLTYAMDSLEPLDCFQQKDVRKRQGFLRK